MAKKSAPTWHPAHPMGWILKCKNTVVGSAWPTKTPTGTVYFGQAEGIGQSTPMPTLDKAKRWVEAEVERSIA